MNMEVADQWRREWAGTAEFGKVTEGGVTRRIARAMEVLHASRPGARVRVMRAAYHSTSGPGAPAESFMLHSSRRVISSGFNYLEPPSLHISTKPLEISSTPLEPYESNGETENYKVTEPDDLEISEPSKWKTPTRGTSIRMPSEDSSSTDNASIIDLDPKNNMNLHRKYSYDSESSDVQLRSRSNSRTSQCLDVPVTLSTLKYKSLLNNTNEWNTRRKSYSFEDTSPLNETVLHKNETLAMESSTDSGICKSTEIMNDHLDDNCHKMNLNKDDLYTHNKEESFKDWLSKNRQNSQYRETKFKTYREHEIVLEDRKENSVAVQSHGRVSITLPVTIEADGNNNNTRNIQTTDDVEKRVKKVEFCKTELHFAAESGKVNIIATDEKPPPSNDFRKRRSAFVPMQDIIDRPITLFGEKNELHALDRIGKTPNGDFGESDEYTAATKSILKNKIPKPKPYLLGENMEFGPLCDVSNKNIHDPVRTTISMVNKQLESEKNYKGHTNSLFSGELEKNIINGNVFRTINAGPTKQVNLKYEKPVETNIKIEKESDFGGVKSKVNSLNISPVPVNFKTRQLRESDLTYFGICSDHKPTHKDEMKIIKNNFQSDNMVENIFQSVKLIKRVSNSVSNSVCNSEPESEDAPEYQNLPMNINFAPVPTPRSRLKYDNNEVRSALTPITEKEFGEVKNVLKSCSRRTKSRKQEDIKASRSLSEPPKNFKNISLQKSNRRDAQVLSSRKQQSLDDTSGKTLGHAIKNTVILREDIPIYVNLNIDAEVKQDNKEKLRKTSPSLGTQANRGKDKMLVDKLISDSSSIHKKKDHRRSDSGTSSNRYSVDKDTLSSSLKREGKPIHTEKVSKLHQSRDKKIKDLNNLPATNKNDRYKSADTIIEKKEHSSRALQRSLPKNIAEESKHTGHHTSSRDASIHRKRNSSTDNLKPTRENRKLSPKQRLGSSVYNSSVQTKTIDKDKEFDLKSNNHKGKHREYIINYDDKNGTVSSICKRTTEIGSRRKTASKDTFKENHEEKPLKTKHKIVLMQLEDHQKDPIEKKYAGRKWKTKVHVQGSCQLL